MIDSVAGYKCVNVTDPDLSRFIKGDIMPVRDNRGDGSWRALKYEDLLFLREARLERIYWRKIPKDYEKEEPPGRMLSGRAFLNAIFTGNVGGEYINKDSKLPSNWKEAGTAKETIADAEVEKGTPSYARIGRVLSGELIRGAFWHVKQRKRTLAFEQGIEFSGNEVYTSWYNFNEAPDTAERLTEINQVNKDIGTIRAYSFGGSSRVGQGLVTHSYNIAGAVEYPWVASGWLMLHVMTRAWDVNESTKEAYNEQRWEEWKAYRCVVANKRINLPGVNTLSIAEEALRRHSIAYRTVPEVSFTGHANVDIDARWLVCDHEFPAEINSLNWDWEPEEEED